MSKSQEYVFVLWGNRFDEAIATIFTTELRKAGLRVIVVGLTQRRIRGLYGLALVPDLTLEEALPMAYQTICVVIPCQLLGMKQLESDPRLRDLFGQAQDNKAIFVISQDAKNLSLCSVFMGKKMVYPNKGDMVAFAGEVACQLT